jgi:hypothetical protein
MYIPSFGMYVPNFGIYVPNFGMKKIWYKKGKFLSQLTTNFG